MQRRSSAALLVLLVLALCPLSFARAEEDPNKTISANISAVNNYVFRGITQTKGEPALQGAFDYNHSSGVFLEIWGSNVEFNTERPHFETDYAGGYKHQVSDLVSITGALYYYTYWKAGHFNAFEPRLTLNVSDFNGGFAWSPDWGTTDGTAGYFWVGWGTALPLELSVAASAGYSYFSSKAPFKNYIDYKLGIARPLLGLTVDVSGSLVNIRQKDIFGDDTKPTLVVTLSKKL